MKLFEHPYIYFTLLAFLMSLGAILARKYQRNLLFWILASLVFWSTGIFILFLLGPKKKKKSLKKEAPSKNLPPYSWYYLDEQAAKRGPFSSEGLKGLWNEGVLDNQSYLWNETLEEWKKAGEFPFLQENLIENENPTS